MSQSRVNKNTTFKCCLTCGNLFKVRICILKKGRGKYCSVKCGAAKRFTAAIEAKLCKQCGFPFSHYRIASAPKTRGQFCSTKCKAQFHCLPGHLSHSWKGGTTQPSKIIRNSTKYQEWRSAVYLRDGYACFFCGSHGVQLNAHHIKPFAKYPDLRFAIFNGVTLCVPCHKKVHALEKQFRP